MSLQFDGPVKGAYLNGTKLFDNTNTWDKLVLVSDSKIIKGDAFAKLDGDGNLHVIGYVQVNSLTSNLNVFALPTEISKNYGLGSSTITGVPNPMPIWWSGIQDVDYDYLDVANCQVTNGSIQLVPTGSSRAKPAIAIFPDVTLKPTS